MNIVFNTGSLNVRGTNVALFDYAKYNQTILGNKSIIVAEQSSDLFSYNKFKKEFEVITYESFDKIEEILKEKKADAFYHMKDGYKDGKITKCCKNLIHVVFSHFEPHGEVYAYISSWLSQEMTGGKFPYVPHIVDLPKIKNNMRKELNIPKDAIVFGRHGGYTQFDIKFVKDVVKKVARKRKDIYFLFLNTRIFTKRWPYKNLKNIIYLPPTYDLIAKTKFINSCDAMLHARKLGETFGLSICEFLHQDKPIITWAEGRDHHHHSLLSTKGIYYKDKKELYNILMDYRKQSQSGSFHELIKEFSPEIVMEKFKNVFLK